MGPGFGGVRRRAREVRGLREGSVVMFEAGMGFKEREVGSTFAGAACATRGV